MARRVFKRQKRVVGDIVRVELGDGFHVYARVLEEASFAFYDLRSDASADTPIDQIKSSPILFHVAVMDYAVKRGRWKIVGRVGTDDGLNRAPPSFIQDIIQPDQFRIYETGAMRPATRAECIGLEAAAVWDPEHVEDRLRDHYAGRPNKWVESLKMDGKFKK